MHAACLSYFAPWFIRSNNIGWSVPLKNLLVTQSSSSSCYLFFIGSKYYPHNFVLIMFELWEKNKDRLEYREEGILYRSVTLCFVLVDHGIGLL
jgi:hypothetical protein